MSRDEAEAVIAHEISHIANGDMEIPEFIEARRAFPDEKVLFIGVSLDQDQGEYFRFVKQTPFNFPVHLAQPDVINTFGVKMIPKTLVYDATGQQALNHAGYMHAPQVEGAAGSVAQVRAVAAACVEAAKRGQACLVLVGHVTKDGQIAGPKLLEHMVDTVLSLEGERRHLFRILRVLKNRYGPTDELLVMEMAETGLAEVPDPSTFFLGDRDAAASGSAVVMAVEGRRPFAVEVQALAAKSFLAMPRRAALGLDVGRLHLLLAVLEKRLRLNLGQTDIYAKIGGGLRIQDPGLDLGIAAAVLSSFYDRPLPAGAVLWGEVALSGRIRPVSGHETRLKQATRLGYGPILCPDAKVSTLSELAAALFSKGR